MMLLFLGDFLMAPVQASSAGKNGSWAGVTEGGLSIPCLPGVAHANWEREVYWLHITFEEEEQI